MILLHMLHQSLAFWMNVTQFNNIKGIVRRTTLLCYLYITGCLLLLVCYLFIQY